MTLVLILSIIMQVVLPVGMATNDTWSTRFMEITSSPVDLLIGTSLYDVTVDSVVLCQSTCVSENSCIMTTFDNDTLTCSLYTYGSTFYVPVDEVHFVETKQANVSGTHETILLALTQLNYHLPGVIMIVTCRH